MADQPMDPFADVTLSRELGWALRSASRPDSFKALVKIEIARIHAQARVRAAQIAADALIRSSAIPKR